MGFSWLFDKNRLIIWHQFITLIQRHLEDTNEIDEFYFTLLLDASKRWEKQNPKRLVCESYLKLLTFEGRTYFKNICYLCEMPLKNEISLMQGFKFTHPHCLNASFLHQKQIEHFLTTQKTTFFDDNEIEYLYSIILKGL